MSMGDGVGGYRDLSSVKMNQEGWYRSSKAPGGMIGVWRLGRC